jgi:calcium-dependent protein kinase
MQPRPTNSLISQANLVFSKSTKLSDDYKIIKKLGSGAFSEVFLIQDKTKDILDCVKVIDKKSLSSYEGEDIMNEIQTLAEMDHPNIMKIKGYYQTNNHLYIISEYLSGGELFDRIIKAKKFTEEVAASVMEQILSAVSYLHKHNIIHRDLKPENICFESPHPDSLVKIIDFGTSKKVLTAEKLKSKLGTAYYIAPEVLAGGYDMKCDVWSCGIILYVFLFGNAPFNARTDDEIFSKIKLGKFKFPDSTNVSQSAKDLITLMLTMNPESRPTADQCLKHEWFQKMRGKSVDFSTELNTLSNLAAFKAKSQFQKAVLLYFVSYFDLKEEKKRLLQIFKEIDADHDGQLDRDEIASAFNSLSERNRINLNIDELFRQIDVNKTNKVDFTEFLLATVNYKKSIHEKELRQIFNSIDRDKSGFLTREEVGVFFSLSDPQHQAALVQLMNDGDKNKDGMISFDEFVTMMNSFLNA